MPGSQNSTLSTQNHVVLLHNLLRGDHTSLCRRNTLFLTVSVQQICYNTVKPVKKEGVIRMVPCKQIYFINIFRVCTSS